MTESTCPAKLEECNKAAAVALKRKQDDAARIKKAYADIARLRAEPSSCVTKELERLQTEQLALSRSGDRASLERWKELAAPLGLRAAAKKRCVEINAQKAFNFNNQAPPLRGSMGASAAAGGSTGGKNNKNPKKRYVKSPKGKRLVRKGPRGGKYYIYKGKKVYLKKKNK